MGETEREGNARVPDVLKQPQFREADRSKNTRPMCFFFFASFAKKPQYHPELLQIAAWKVLEGDAFLALL